MRSVPFRFQPALWSSDISKIDADKSYRSVILQLLNYGGEKGEDWVFSNYPEGKIKEVVISAARGSWFRHVLRKWLNYFDVTLDPLNFDMAINSIRQPRYLVEEFWRRALENKNEILSRNT